MEFKTHKPIDRADPGFEIPGKKLRWISPDISEVRGDRPFQVLRKDELPAKLVEHISKFNPSAFSDGSTIRRGKLVLAYSTDEAFKAYSKEIHQAAIDQEDSVRQVRGATQSVRDFAKVTTNETYDDTQRMIEKFKKPKGE